MNTRTQRVLLLALLAGAVVFYVGRAAVRAHHNLVTLDVRNMDVRKVVNKLQWQTWERIFVDKNVQGKVTLQVRNVPLEEVLRIVSDQTFSRWSVIYPLYSSGRSFTALKKCLRGEMDPAQNGWTNLQSRGFFGGGPFRGGGPGGPFGEPDTPTNRLVSLNIYNKDLSLAVLAFDRYARARVVPEDGAAPTVTLTLRQAEVSDAVAALAKAARLNWARLYTLQGGFGFGGPGGPPAFALRGGTNSVEMRGPGGAPPPGADAGTNATEVFGFGRGRRPEMTDEQREELRKQREALEAQLRQVLPEAERQRLEQAQQQREQLFQEMQNLTPEQRRERFMQMRGADMSRRGLDRLRNSTPEQRVEGFRRMQEMRRRFEERQRQQQPGQPGAPGQPPPPAPPR